MADYAGANPPTGLRLPPRLSPAQPLHIPQTCVWFAAVLWRFGPIDQTWFAPGNKQATAPDCALSSLACTNSADIAERTKSYPAIVRSKGL